MRRTRYLAIALVAVLAGLLGTVGAQAASYIFPALRGDQVVVSGCVLRFDTPDGTPRIHANYSHHCAGVEKVFINGNGDIEVKQSLTNANAVIFAFAQADETLVTRGIQVGASGGITKTVFRLYDGKLGRKLNLRSASDRKRVQGNSSNLWVGWVNRG